MARKSKKEKEKEKAKKERPKTGGPGSKLFEEVSYNGSTNRSNTPGKLSVSSMLESCPSDVIPVIEEKSLPEEKPKVVWKMGTSSSNFYSVLGDGAAQLMVQLREGGGGGKASGNRKRTGTAAFFEELKEGAEKLSTQAELLRPNQKVTLSKARESLPSSISSSAVEPVSTPQTPRRSKREKSLSSSACEQRASRRASKRDKKRSNSGGSISSRISSKINNSEKKGKEKEVSQRGPDKEEAESELREEEKEKEEHQPSSLYDALPSPAADDSLLLLSTVSRTEESVVSGFSVDRSAAVVTEQMTGDMAAREEEQEHPYAQQQAGEDPTSTTEQQKLNSQQICTDMKEHNEVEEQQEQICNIATGDGETGEGATDNSAHPGTRKNRHIPL